MESPSPALSYFGFIIISVVGYAILLMELKSAIQKTDWDEGRRKKVFNVTVITIIGWTIFISLLGFSGFLSDFSTLPPRILIVLLIPLVTILFVTFSKTLKELLPHIPVQNIIRLQVFRVFVEVTIWMLVLENSLPVQMSFEGRNFDVVSGLTAPIMAWFFTSNPTLLKVWNFICLGILLNILTIAILSMPLPIRYFMNEPANTLVGQFPYVWLPGLLVPLAYGLHFFSLRQLSLKK